jgi:hypothetical protein
MNPSSDVTIHCRECLDPIDDLTRSIKLEARDAEISNPDKRKFPTNFISPNPPIQSSTSNSSNTQRGNKTFEMAPKDQKKGTVSSLTH